MKNRIVFWAAVYLAFGLVDWVNADILPAGHKSVQHQLVFQDSNSLSGYRLVAAPIAGFKGEVEIKANQPFRFSTKYGTRIYVIPDEVDELPPFDREVYQNWLSSAPPRGEIKSVPVFNPVASALTTVRLLSVSEDELNLEVVKHEEFDSSGSIVTGTRKTVQQTVMMGIPVLAGIAICTVMLLQVRQKNTATKKLESSVSSE